MNQILPKDYFRRGIRIKYQLRCTKCDWEDIATNWLTNLILKKIRKKCPKCGAEIERNMILIIE